MKTVKWEINYRINGGQWRSLGVEKATNAATAIGKALKHFQKDLTDCENLQIEALKREDLPCP